MKPTRYLSFLAPIFCALSASAVHAATGTWVGGTGNWDTTDVGWTGVSGTPWDSTNGAANVASFGGTAGTVTLTTGVFANGLTFATTGYTITGNTLTLAGTTPTITNTSPVTATISSILAGTNLTKAGTGTVLLTGTNTYTGTTSVTGTLASSVAAQGFGTNLSGISMTGTGTLSLRNDSTTSFTNGTSAYNIANSASAATINVDRVTGTGSNTLTVGNLTTSSGAVTWQLNFTGANGVSLSAGALTTPTAALGSHTINNNIAGGGSLTLASVAGGGTGATATLIFAGTGNTTVSGAITQTATAQALTKNGAGTLTLNAANSYTGATTLSAGALSVGTTSNLGAAASNLVFDGGTLQITGTTLTNFSGIGHTVSFNAAKLVGLDINNAANTFTADQVLNQTTGGLTKSGAGSLILNQANTFTGATIVSAGTLNLSGATAAIGSASTFLRTGGILQLTSTSGNALSNASASVFGDSGTGNFTLDSGVAETVVSLQASGGTINVSLSSGSVLTVSNASQAIFPGTAATTGTIILDGLGAVNAAGARIGHQSGSSGTLTLKGGVMFTTTSGIASGDAGATAVTVQSLFDVQNGTLNASSGSQTIESRTIKVGASGTITTAATGSIIVDGGGTNGNSSIVAGGTITTGILNVARNANTAVFDHTGGNVSATTLTLNGTSGTGTYNLAGGTLTINSGTAGSGIKENTGTSTFNFAGGTLKAGANNTNFMVVDTANINDGGATIDTNGKDITIAQALLHFAGATTDTLTKNGTGTLTLSGANTYTGATTVAAGTLAVNGSALADAGKLVITSGVVAPTGTEVVATLYFGAVQQASGTWGSSTAVPTPAHIDDTHFSGTGVVSVTTGTGGGGYNSWAGTNAGGQTANLDFDNDGMANGVEYFMNITTPGFTASPSLDGTNTVTWTNGGNIPSSAYGTQFRVQTSSDLVIWADVPNDGSDTHLTNSSGSVSYMLTGVAPRFVRLKVTPTP